MGPHWRVRFFVGDSLHHSALMSKKDAYRLKACFEAHHKAEIYSEKEPSELVPPKAEDKDV